MRSTEEIEQDRKNELAELNEIWVNLENNFKPGTMGFHELVDRIAVISQAWEDTIQNHPTCILDGDLYIRIYRIGEMISSIYNDLGLEEDDSRE